MTAELTAHCAAVAFALFAVYGWLGLCVSTPLTAPLVALTTERMVIVSPIVATTPLFSLIISLIFCVARKW